MSRLTPPYLTWSALRRRRGSPLLAAAVMLTVGCGLAWAWATPSESRAVHTSRPKFRIPFQFDAEEMERLGAAEIRLFVSTDRGRRWQHAQTVAPGDAKFTFEATGDGEYWFAVRTVDGQGQLHPPGAPQPGLQVVVDQTAPTFSVALRESAAGEVQLTWAAADDHLDVSSLDLEFLDPNTTEWHRVNVTPAESAQTTWRVPQGGRVLVRGSIADRAGNSTAANASVDIGSEEPGQAPVVRPDFSQPVAGAEPETLAINPPAPPRDSTFPTSLLPTMLPIPGVGAPLSRAVSGPVEPPVASPLEPARAVTATAPVPTPEPTGDGSTRVVRATTFSINYELEEVGPSGVGAVDLYITENNGFKWFYYGPDEDKRSPAELQVPADGSYGFAIRVRSGAGLVQDPPQPGEAPTLVVLVDRQAPKVEITAVRQGTEPGEVEIDWTVRDDRLATQPVLLSCSTEPAGPWQPISDWIDNSGRYRWKVGSEWARPVYLRVEARDAAGNVGHFDTRTPVALDLSRPSARITDIEAIEPVAPH